MEINAIQYKLQYFLMAPQSIALCGPPEAYILPLETTGLTVYLIPTQMT